MDIHNDEELSNLGWAELIDLVKNLRDLMDEAQWAGDFWERDVCPWCYEEPGAHSDCDAALVMGWRQK